MKHKLMKLLIWILRKLESKPEPELTVSRLNGRIILPDSLSGDITEMRITFDEPVSPARVMENLDGGTDIKNPIPDRSFILYTDSDK